MCDAPNVVILSALGASYDRAKCNLLLSDKVRLEEMIDNEVK